MSLLLHVLGHRTPRGNKHTYAGSSDLYQRITNPLTRLSSPLLPVVSSQTLPLMLSERVLRSTRPATHQIECGVCWLDIKRLVREDRDIYSGGLSSIASHRRKS